MAVPPSAEESRLAEMFPALSLATVRDVVRQCGGNCEAALDQLLTLAELKAQGCTHVAAPATHQVGAAGFRVGCC